MTDDPYLDDQSPLQPGDAVAAILVASGGRYVLQHRDAKRGIFFPGCWGCFGGGVDPDDDSVEAALRRELQEELALDIPASHVNFFTTYTFDMRFCGGTAIFRTFYEVGLTDLQLAGLRLGEGSEWRAFTAREALSGLRLVPYDAFALWTHANRHRLIAPREA
jgi:8-oxo-dGTP pyrophosphatase MutT (NUDIX family)